jgi:5,10-methylenetetrahydromethanopterin reductase
MIEKDNMPVSLSNDVDVFVIPNPELRVTTKIARLLDEHAIHGAWIADSPPTHWRDVYATLALCAVDTTRIKLGPGVTNPVTRHPSVTAAAIATIESLAPGRAVLGIGIGDAAVKGIGLKPSSLEELERYIQSVRHVLAERSVSVPVYLSASGPRMLEMAGRIADGVLISVGAHPALLQEAMARVLEGVKAAGRRPDNIDFGFIVSLAASDDEAQARRAARPLAAKKSKDFAGGLFSIPEALRHLVPDARALRDRYDYKFHFKPDAPHNEFVTEELIDVFTVAGSTAQCVAKLAAIFAFLREKGAGRVVFQPGGGLREKSIELLVGDILPRLRAPRR